jgi:hypothetical protein
MVRLITCLFIAVSASACVPNGQTSTKESDWAAIQQLEAQARTLAKTDGCSVTSDCATGAIGRKACGGPRDFLVYCRKTTDVNALNAKLDEIVKAETAYNTKYDLMSTCEMRAPPLVEASGGSCRAK